MQLTNNLLHALLVACDQSYQDAAHGGAIVGAELNQLGNGISFGMFGVGGRGEQTCK